MTNRDDDPTLQELASVADELLEQAAALRRRFAELGDVLGIDLEAAVASPGEIAIPVVATPPNGEAPTAPLVEPAPDPDAVSVAVRADFETEEDHDPVRVLAFDMMLSGRSRKDIVEFVRATYGQDTDVSVIDELFDAR